MKSERIVIPTLKVHSKSFLFCFCHAQRYFYPLNTTISKSNFIALHYSPFTHIYSSFKSFSIMYMRRYSFTIFKTLSHSAVLHCSIELTIYSFPKKFRLHSKNVELSIHIKNKRKRRFETRLFH